MKVLAILELMELILYSFYCKYQVVHSYCNILLVIRKSSIRVDLRKKSWHLLEVAYNTRNAIAHMYDDVYVFEQSFEQVLRNFENYEEFKEVMQVLLPAGVPDCVYNIYNLVTDEKTETYNECLAEAHVKLRDESLGEGRCVGNVRRNLKQRYNTILVDTCMLDELTDTYVVPE